MSLTSDLRTKDSFARAYIDEHFPTLGIVSRECNQSLRSLGIAENPHAHKVVSMLVGTAIDYRVRTYFRRGVYRSLTIQDGLSVLERDRLSRSVDARGCTRFRKLKNYWSTTRAADRLGKSFERFIATLRLRRPLEPKAEERMCRYCLLFAYFDWIGRAPWTSSALDRMTPLGRLPVPEILRSLDAAIVADVVKLSRLFAQQHFALMKSARKVTIGGVLAGSADVLGADFDLILDGVLLDFKTSVQPKVTTDMLRQLVGYWLLDYDDKYRIGSVGVVLMRHGHARQFRIIDLLTAGAVPGHVRAGFRDGVRAEAAERRERFRLEFDAMIGRARIEAGQRRASAR